MSLNKSLPFSPADLGMPAKFSSWRHSQPSMILDIIDSEKRFVTANAPTGIGKSLVAMAAASLVGRTCILTASKGLQDQYMKDFASIGLVDIRGRANYPCIMSTGLNCEDGGHMQCPHRGGCGCAYKSAYQEALSRDAIVSNYSYWIAAHKYGEGLGKFDLLILDEAHSAPDEVCAAMSVHITSEEVYRVLGVQFPKNSDSMDEWRSWARAMQPRAEAEKEKAELYVKSRGGSVSVKEARYLGAVKTLLTKLETISLSSGDWVAEADTKGGGYHLDPVWASDYADKLLFLDVPKILFVSATVLPKTMDLLGVKPEEYDYHEYPAVFDPNRNPVIHVPTVRVTHQTFKSKGIVDLWLMRVDQLIKDRLDRKGIIHTVSYDRARTILERSEYAEYMISHRTQDAMKQAQYFRDVHPPAVMLSPSMNTGYDFAHTQCEYQIICKVPYPDTRSKIMQARCDSKTGDPLYGPYITAQALVQSTGRGMRAENDRCENLVIDDQIRSFLGQCKGIQKEKGFSMLPNWWLKMYRRCDSGLPVPPAKLQGR